MSGFEAKRVSRSATLKLAAPADSVFPLFRADREGEWASSWRYDPVYPASGLIEEGGVFKTTHQGEDDKIWVVSKYDPQLRRIEYLTLKPDSAVGRIEIAVDDDLDGTASARIVYTYTALSEQGASFIAEFTEENFRHNMMWWEKAINHFLETGEALAHPH